MKLWWTVHHVEGEGTNSCPLVVPATGPRLGGMGGREEVPNAG